MAKITYDNKIQLNENANIPNNKKCRAVDMNEIKNVVNENDTNVGSLSNLNTTDKASVVNAINEVNTNQINSSTYSTNEIVIGTFLGKPLYRKVLTGTLPTGKGENSFNLSSECLIKRKYGRIKSILGSIFELDTYYVPSTAYSISSWITADEHTLNVECGANYNKNSEFEITVEYIKTTD